MSEPVCYCRDVQKSAVLAAIEAGCLTVDSLSRKLGVCTGCGSCRPDIEALLRFAAEEKRLQPQSPELPLE